jgi:hydroxyacylglutathione hydrolase
MARVNDLRSRGLPTVPSTLAEELATNPFLRPDNPAIRSTLQMNNADDWQIFAEIRRLKDEFRG